MNTSNQPIRNPIQHLESPNSEMWMGLVDGIYAIAMTFIAIELPELATQLLEAPGTQGKLPTVGGIIFYEFITYTITFLILYELWSFHKSILKISGIRHAWKNFINGLILALTCLCAGNIILILKTKTELASNEIKAGLRQSTILMDSILNDWFSHGAATSVCTMLIIASMFWLMSALTDCDKNHKEAANLRFLKHTARKKAYFFVLFPINWLPMLFGSRSPLAPEGIIVFIYITLSSIKGDNIRNYLRTARKKLRRRN